jgi:hypothetical protein
MVAPIKNYPGDSISGRKREKGEKGKKERLLPLFPF